MAKYLISVGDSDKYSVEFPGSKEEYVNSEKFNELKNKVASFLKDKFPMGGFVDVVPFHIEKADNNSNYPALDVNELLKSAAKQIGVEKFTDKLNLNAPFDIN